MTNKLHAAVFALTFGFLAITVALPESSVLAQGTPAAQVTEPAPSPYTSGTPGIQRLPPTVGMNPVAGSSLSKTSDVVIENEQGKRARADARRIRCSPLAACETDGSLIQGR